MKKIIVLLFSVIFLTLLQAYDWSDFGMDSGEINNFCFTDHPGFWEIVCGADGFYTYGTEDWMLHSYGGLPVWDLCSDGSGTSDLIVIMGNGSYSDGIYAYTFDIEEFAVRYWFLEPEFLLQDATLGTYFVGGSSGLVYSENGVSWQEVTEFNGMDCHAMAIYGNNYVVSANDSDIFYSDDSGENWYAAESYLLISKMCFDSTGKLYGIFPDMSWSSGLWSSMDFGLTWQIEFWDTMLNAVYTDLSDKVFVGWKNGTPNQGLAQWIPEEEGFYFYNYGLSDLNINKITTHPFIDCINLICCTDNGSYMLTDYEITPVSDELPETNGEMSIYPNPFNPETIISFQVSDIIDQEDMELVIYNIKGQKINDLTNSLNRIHQVYAGQAHQTTNNYTVIWDGTENSGRSVSAGIYFARLKNSDRILQKKMLLLK